MEKPGNGRKRVDQLEDAIRHHQTLYYNGDPAISDVEFDALWDELKSLNPDSPMLSAIGADAQDGWPKAEHILPMGSQEKAADPDEFLAWAAKRALSEYVVELKMDGASLELQYRDGRLDKAVTRGNGLIGDDITPNVRRMAGVPARLPAAWSGAVRGEVLMSRATHAAHFADKANCRNAANGLMKRKDGVGVERLQVLCYDAAPLGLYDDASQIGTDARPPFDDEVAKLAWLETAGFSVVQHDVLADAYAVVDYRARIMAERSGLPYDIDGLVVKARSVDTSDMRRARPERQIAFKFALEEAVSTLLAVEWSESGATYTPIGLIEPVRLAGTTVKRANLNNTNTINGMGLQLGSRVIVVKRGEIIPKIEGLVENPAGTQPIAVPTSCGCGAALVDEGTRLYCPNKECPKKNRHRLEKWLGVLDIRDFGPAIIAKLCDSGRVRGIADLYSLSVEELQEYERMGPALAGKILQNLRSRAEIGLADFVAGFDIEGIGSGMADKAVAAGFDTLDKLRAARPEQLAAVDGFAAITAATLADGLAALTDEMDRLLAGGGVRIRPPAEAGGRLSGKSFCFTGEMVSLKRARAEALVKAQGAMVKSSVGQDLSYLVTNDPASGSAKNKTAIKYGVPIIDEPQFLALLDQATPEGQQ